MKKRVYTLMVLVVLTISAISTVKAQEWSAGVDLYSSYVWRGSKAGGASIQPTIKFADKGFTIGAWGSGDLTTGSPEEADLFASYAFDFGLSVGLSDYHYNADSLFGDGAHALEANIGYVIDKFSLSGNYIFNEASGAMGGDKYIEASYQFPSVKLFVGAGDGWYTSDQKFNLCNVGLTVTKSIKITDSFSLPMSGSVIVNPEKQQIFYVVGISL